MTSDLATKAAAPRHRSDARPTGPFRLVVVLIAVVCVAVLALILAQTASAATTLDAAGPLLAAVALA